MSRPNLGYSNFYWIRKDQMRLKKQAQREAELKTELKTELTPELTSETTPVQTHVSSSSSSSSSSSLLEVPEQSLEETLATLPDDKPDSVFNEPQESTALLVVGQNVSAWGTGKSVEK